MLPLLHVAIPTLSPHCRCCISRQSAHRFHRPRHPRLAAHRNRPPHHLAPPPTLRTRLGFPAPSPAHADWNFTSITENGSTANLLSASAEIIEDQLVGDSHLLIRLTFAYPAWHTEALYEIRAYPGAPGLWTRVSLRLTQDVDKMNLSLWPICSFAECLFLETTPSARTAVGYYNDTQHRNHDDLCLLREETLPAFTKRQVVNWANFLCLDRDGEGLVLLKESHKCANQPGTDTGAFVLHPHQVLVTGLGLKSTNYQSGHWLRPGEFRPCWAHWCILYSGGPLETPARYQNLGPPPLPVHPRPRRKNPRKHLGHPRLLGGRRARRRRIAEHHPRNPKPRRPRH